MRFPVTVRHRTGKVKIYAPAKGFPYYRMCFTAVGKRQRQTFGSYSEAKAAAEKKAKELHSNSVGASLTARQAQDALVAYQKLENFRQATGRKFSLLGAVSELTENLTKLKEIPLGEAVDTFLRNSAVVEPKDIGLAVTDFLNSKDHLTRSADGKRAQLSAKYAYVLEKQLRRFADTFPGTAVCDLSKAHLDKFISTLGEQSTKSHNKRKITSAKSRNHYRGMIRQFLAWCVRKDYLSPAHRLFEADTMRPELANTAEVEFYLPKELASLLAKADDSLGPLIAIGGLAGLRTAELLRLDWGDVWRVAGHIEVTAGKAKTRQRRLVEICPALAAWLKPVRKKTAGKLWIGHEVTFQQHFVELCESAKVPRKRNGLRHSFCSYHFALHADENLTSQQSGNSPAMIHAHYKGLATKADAEEWFGVKPVST